MVESKLTADRARDIFEYRDGKLFYRIRVNKKLAGSQAGSLQSDGYVRVKVDGRAYRAHRVVWLIVHGAWPDGFLDHINGDCADNRIENLRVATNQQNQQNRQITVTNQTGAIGVTWENNAWRARIKVAGKKIDLGRYQLFDEAFAARKAAESLHGFHPNHGRSRANGVLHG